MKERKQGKKRKETILRINEERSGGELLSRVAKQKGKKTSRQRRPHRWQGSG